MTLTIEIEQLCSTHKTNKFKLGHEAYRPLKTFIQRDALDFHVNGIARTYVLSGIDKSNPQAPKPLGIMAYITLICSQIDLRGAYEVEDCPGANKYDSLPALKIARLAVDARYQSQTGNGLKLGTILVELAVTVAIEKIAKHAGCRFLVTDAKHQSIGFYKKRGFILFNEEQVLLTKMKNSVKELFGVLGKKLGWKKVEAMDDRTALMFIDLNKVV